jgi:hypothetical protein
VVGAPQRNQQSRFLLIAVLLWKRASGKGRDLQSLAGLVFAVGLGSLVFHTVATRWAALLDIAFIALFVLIFHQRFQVRVLGTGDGKAWAGTAAFVALAALFVAATRGLPPLPLNGSEIYLPPSRCCCGARGLPAGLNRPVRAG